MDIVLVMFILMVVLLFIGVPVAFVLGLVSLAWLLVEGISLRVIPMRVYAGINLFVLMAIPFFIFAGGVMNRGGITERLVRFVDMIVGRVRGGLAHVNIYSSLLFAGISGSAIADVSAIGSILIPAMEKDGYTKKFSAMITASSSIVGPIIPPSITIVLYGALSGVSIAGLFAAAVIPGLLIGVGQSILVAFLARRKRLPKAARDSFSVRRFAGTSRDALAALIMPIIILGGILGGVFTPTEAAAVACAYALLIGFFLYRQLRLRDLPGLFLEAVKTSAMLFLIIGTASILGWIFARKGIPGLLAEFLLGISQDPRIVVLLVVVLLLFIGTWLETGASIVMLVPVLPPMMDILGYHPLHSGVLIVVGMLIGLITPPLGMCLFTAAGVSGAKVEEIFAELWPFLIVHVVVLLLIGFVPSLTLFLPRLLGFA